jgi:hypothetical protein
LPLQRVALSAARMHLRPIEIDKAHSLSAQGKTPSEVQSAIQGMRNKLKGKPAAPHVNNIRNVLKGQTYQKSQKETRGRPQARIKMVIEKKGNAVPKD